MPVAWCHAGEGRGPCVWGNTWLHLHCCPGEEQRQIPPTCWPQRRRYHQVLPSHCPEPSEPVECTLKPDPHRQSISFDKPSSRKHHPESVFFHRQATGSGSPLPQRSVAWLPGSGLGVKTGPWAAGPGDGPGNRRPLRPRGPVHRIQGASSLFPSGRDHSVFSSSPDSSTSACQPCYSHWVQASTGQFQLMTAEMRGDSHPGRCWAARLPQRGPLSGCTLVEDSGTIPSPNIPHKSQTCWDQHVLVIVLAFADSRLVFIQAAEVSG